MTQRGEDVESKFILTGQNNTAKAFGEAAKNLKMLGGQAMQTDKLFKSMMGGQRGAGAQRGGFPMMRMGMAGAAFGAGRYLRNQIGKADQITDLADSMGVSPETAQTLRVLSRDTSVSFEGLGRTFAKLNDGMVEAQADPEGGIAESFSLIGLSADRLKEMNVEQVFERLSRVMADSRTPAFQLKAAQDLLGGSATKLNAIYQQVGSQGFEALNAAMIKSGRIIDQEGITKLAQLEGKLEEIQDKASVATMRGMLETAEQVKKGNLFSRFGQFMNEGATNVMAAGLTAGDSLTTNISDRWNQATKGRPLSRGELGVAATAGSIGVVITGLMRVLEEVDRKMAVSNQELKKLNAKEGGVFQ